MGDMADFTLEHVEHEENLRFEYRQGRLSTNEAYENGIIDETGCDITSQTLKTCRCCNKSGLSWGNYNNKWVLFDGNAIHQCPTNPLKEKP